MMQQKQNAGPEVVQIRGAALDGVAARPVQVEATVYGDGTGIDVIGLPDTAVRESRMRIARAARRFGVKDSRRTLINLAPATLRKEGTALDLAMAVAYVAAHTRRPLVRAEDFLIAGEISLKGEATGLITALPVAILARQLNAAGLVLPRSALPQASVVEGLPLYGVDDIGEAMDVLHGERRRPSVVGRTPPRRPVARNLVDLAQVKGQEVAKRALCIAAVGGHNVLMVGPPGSGKTMLARALPGILAPLELDEALEAATIHAAVGRPRTRDFYVRPFRAPHHTSSRQALVGGGATPRPGEVTLAHRGVLFLDELPEFGRDALEVLRQPLEDRQVTISRSQTCRTFPADFMLIAAMNPCPCGYHGDPEGRCLCSDVARSRYRQRISGPLLDRFDLHLPVRRVKAGELLSGRPGRDTHTLRQEVERARDIRERCPRRRKAGLSNAALSGPLLEEVCGLNGTRRTWLAERIEKLGFSGRAYVRILRVARSIADLEARADVSEGHLLEAMQFRSLDRA